MKLHKEGTIIILVSFLLLAGLIASLFWLLGAFWLTYILGLSALVFWFLIIQFFRVPKRTVTIDDRQVISPADGKVVVIEEVEETEYFNKKCTQISIFMSPTNVHINWYPVSGIVKYFKYHPGKYLVAWHPKSSTLNERTTVVVKSESGREILFRQIAGAVARRIVCYAKEGEQANQSSEFGFIKFGSRVDVFVPIDANIKVELEQMIKGSVTVLAELPK